MAKSSKLTLSTIGVKTNDHTLQNKLAGADKSGKNPGITLST
jgi:hypothetical protein